MNPLEANESLYAAAEEDDLLKLNEAIDAGADIEYKSPKNLGLAVGNEKYIWRTAAYSTSLHAACLRGFIPTALRLLEVNAGVNALDEVSFFW